MVTIVPAAADRLGLELSVVYSSTKSEIGNSVVQLSVDFDSIQSLFF